jgi:hypothetical protein
MSNHFAVAAVTATLRRILQKTFDDDLPGALAVHVRPNGPASQLPTTGASVYLYQVTPNLAGRNSDLPTRGPDGTVVQRPRAALDLHFLISFYGDDTTLEPQILLASAVRTLHAQPVLERATIIAMVADPLFTFVKKADLADAPDLVRFSPSSLSLEELSKLWSVFFQTPYVLSVSYQASVVFVDSPIEARAAPLPVRAPVVRAVPSQLPHITEVMSRTGPAAPIVAGQPILPGYTLVLGGRQLVGETTRVRIGEVELAPAAAADVQVEVVLPASLRAGPQLASVVHQVALGAPPKPHQNAASNQVVFMLSPTVSATQTGPAKLRLTFAPKVARRQQVALLLNEQVATPGALPRMYRFSVPHDAAETDVIDVEIPGVAAAGYLLRVQVDGAESPLHVAAGGAYDGPTVTIT